MHFEPLHWKWAAVPGGVKRRTGIPKVVPVNLAEFQSAGPVGVFFMSPAKQQSHGFTDPAFKENKSLPVHRWVNWIAGYSSSFVSSVIRQRELEPSENALVFDPFAGVGTTLVEAKMQGFNTAGFEINPFAAKACRVKLNWELSPTRLPQLHAKFSKIGARIDRDVDTELDQGGVAIDGSLPFPKGFKTRTEFFAKPVLKKTLLLKQEILDHPDEAEREFLLVALGAVLVSFSNYSYEPSLSSREAAGKSLITNAAVGAIFSDRVGEMVRDMKQVRADTLAQFSKLPRSEVIGRTFMEADAHGKENPGSLLHKKIDLLVTSPPYLNNYHYIRNTRPQLFWLDLVATSEDLKSIEQANFGKFWQTVRDGPTLEYEFEHDELEEATERIRALNEDRGVYGGPGWANYVTQYFNDTYSFFSVLSGHMKPGGSAVIVVGNSLIQGVEIKVDEYMADIAEMCGFTREGVHVIRDKRIGSSIVGSTVRKDNGEKKTSLYESAVVVTYND